MPNIHIYKTNINTLQKLKIADHLLSKENKIVKFNIDIEDSDKILRIETEVLDNFKILNALKKEQIYCEEL